MPLPIERYFMNNLCSGENSDSENTGLLDNFHNRNPQEKGMNYQAQQLGEDGLPPGVPEQTAPKVSLVCIYGQMYI